jgi:hypothetical protein
LQKEPGWLSLRLVGSLTQVINQSAQSIASSTTALHQLLLLPTNSCSPTAAQVISVAGTDGNAIGFPPLALRPVRAALLSIHAERMKAGTTSYFIYISVRQAAVSVSCSASATAAAKRWLRSAA